MWYISKHGLNCMVFFKLYTEIISEIFFCLARHTSHCGQPQDVVSFLTDSGNTHSLSHIGKTNVCPTCFISTGCLWPSSRLATKERWNSNCVDFSQSQWVLYKMLAFTMLRSSKWKNTLFHHFWDLWQYP